MFGQEPIAIVELDQDQCTLEYGVTCSAVLGVTGSNKCYNTYRSCQAAADYTRGTLTLRFAKPLAQLPAELQAVPSVVSVSTSPTEINIGGSRRDSGALGKRGTCSIVFSDHPDGDIKTDPYLADRNFNPFDFGTFWSKWLARNPYYKKWPLRIYEGYLGQALEDMQVKHYLLDSITGPDASGNVTVKGRDILTLADDKTALAPGVSTGELLADITAGATTLTVTGGELSDYVASGEVRVGDEIITYTSRALSGSDIVFSGLTRGAWGTEAQAHEAGEVVQACLTIENMLPHDVAKLLLEDYAGIDPAYIPYADWEAEAGEWLTPFTLTTIISEPTGVNELLGRVCKECMTNIWWDEKAREIKLKALTPLTEDPAEFNADGHILEGTFMQKDDPSRRLSRVWVYYQPRNWAEDLDKENNYKKVRVELDLGAESENEYGEKRVEKIYARFIRTDAQAANLAVRYLATYRDIPKEISLSVDAENRETWTGDIVSVTTPELVDFLGGPRAMTCKIISAEETESGQVVKYRMQRAEFLTAAFGRWMAEDAPNYSDATEVEKREGAWWAREDGTMPDGTSGTEWI